MPGTCQLCQTVGSMRTCKLCGLLVCTRHYRTEVGSCTNCKPLPAGSDQPAEPLNLPPLPQDAPGRYA